MLNCLTHILTLLNFSNFNQINDARQIYASCVGKQFQLEYCWVILKKEPKWQFKCASQHQRLNKK